MTLGPGDVLVGLVLLASVVWAVRIVSWQEGYEAGVLEALTLPRKE